MSKDDLDAFLDSIPGMPKAPRATPQPSAPTTPQSTPGAPPVPEIDIGQALMQKMMQQHGPMVPGMGGGMPPVRPDQMPHFQQQERDMVYLREGAFYFKALPAADMPMPVAVKAGPIANSVGKEFVNKGARKYYVLENQHQRVDLGQPNYNNMQVLYMVEAPFAGTILVPESAIIRTGPAKRTLLKG